MSDQNQAQKLYHQTLVRLGSMLKILKKGDSPANREAIQTHCETLSLEGRKQNLFGWVAVMETAKVAIATPNHNFQTTTKLIIKEIKQAAEDLIKGEQNAIAVSDELSELAPSAKTRFMDVETIYTDLNTEPGFLPEEDISSPSKTLERDLWEETLFKDNQEIQNQIQENSDNQPNHSSSEDFFADTFNDDLINTLNSTSEDHNLDDWLDDDSITSDSESLSAIFLAKNNTEALSDYDQEIEDLFEESPGQSNDNIEIDKWTTLSHPEEINNSDQDVDPDWDFLEDDLSENTENLELSADLEDVSISINIGDDNLSNQPEQNKSQGTLIIDNPQQAIDGLLKNPTSPIVSSNRKPSHNILIYENFDELDQLIVGENLLQNDSPSLTIYLKRPTQIVRHYENFSELEKLINSANKVEETVNWQELEQIVNDGTTSRNTDFKTTTVTYSSSELEAELSDLDRLLAQAEKSTPPQQSWTNKPSSPGSSSPKTFEQSMRVPVKHLDNLNNLVGEMVVRRNRLEEDQEKLRQFLDNLLSHAQDLSDVGAKTQDMYEKSLLQGSLISSRKRNQSTVREQLERAKSTVIGNQVGSSSPQLSDNLNSFPDLDDLELDRFSDFHLLAQEMIELVVRIRESTSDIQFLVDETDQLGKNIRDITTQLQEQINKSRMVPFAQNADRLPLPIRKIAQGYNKQVQLKVEGREVLVDKMMLEHLWDPLLQIVKNSVTHGIEQPEERVASGKDSMGTITVRAFLQGPQTVISVSDDGAGINAHKVKQKAIQKKLITPAQAHNLKDQDIFEFLFDAGFTTKDQADSHAGRGVGLDIVRNKLNEIRGSVNIDSTPGQGTTFTIRLPLTLSIGKALCCMNDNVRIAFPIDGIEDTLELSHQDVQTDNQGQETILWNKTVLPLRSLSTLLKYNRQMSRSFMYNSANIDDEHVSIIILRGGNNLLAIQVDQILPEEEIVIKQISGPLPKSKGIAGATVRSDGSIMPIGDVIELIEIAQGNLSNEVKSQMFPESMASRATMLESPASVPPLVLIVDDSITVREMLSITFSKEGYRVEQARDGHEAWQKLRSGLPCNIIFCDIEMPRMNGLELLQHLQEDAELCHIPMAILSSRGSQKHQKIAAEFGACAYLIKPCVDKELLDSAQRMISGEVLLEGSTRVPTSKNTDIQEEINKSTAGYGKRRTSSAPMVLIIDDSVVVREMLSLSFKKAGYEVEVARDGQDAWEKLSEGLPCDLILCDIEMPRMNGLELLARMQQDENLSNLPVAMVTSRGAEKHRSIAAELGAKAYFTKPYIEDELLNVAQRLIKGEVFLEFPAQ